MYSRSKFCPQKNPIALGVTCDQASLYFHGGKDGNWDLGYRIRPNTRSVYWQNAGVGSDPQAISAVFALFSRSSKLEFLHFISCSNHTLSKSALTLQQGSLSVSISSSSLKNLRRLAKGISVHAAVQLGDIVSV